VHKLLIVVELLLGEIPDRLQFRQPSLKRSLMPYFLLTQAVRTGNLAKFNQVLEQFGEKFQADGTYTLIIRLRHNVIKTGEPITGLSCSQPITALALMCACAFRRSDDQPVILSDLSGRHRSEAAARQSRGRRVHRCQGNQDVNNSDVRLKSVGGV
ncbi:hypothetical protein ILYODFUR_014475, partial [Ilyodon furcidens]